MFVTFILSYQCLSHLFDGLFEFTRAYKGNRHRTVAVDDYRVAVVAILHKGAAGYVHSVYRIPDGRGKRKGPPVLPSPSCR